MKRGRSVSVVTVKSELIYQVKSSLGLFHSITPFSSIRGPIHPKNAKRVIGLGFLAMTAAWEDYLEGIFVRYMAGANFPSGVSPRLRVGACFNLSHAYEVYTSKPNFNRESTPLSFSNFGEVVKRATIFFIGAEPFSKVSPQYRDRLADASVIRNRVAHSSRKARNDFRTVALQHLGRRSSGNLGRGFDVGSLLLAPPNIRFAGSAEPTTFEAYADMFLTLADLLAP